MPIAQEIRLEEGLEAFLHGCTAYDHLDSAIAVFDSQGLRYANPAFVSFNATVRDAPEHLGRYPSLLDCPAVAAWLGAGLVEGEYRSSRLPLYYAPQIQSELTLCLRPIKDAGGRCLGAMLSLGEESVGFDRRHLARLQDGYRVLAERIRHLEREKSSADRLVRLLLKDAPIAMLLLNGRRQIVQANRAAERLFEVPIGQMLGRACETVLGCFAQCGHCPALSQGKIEGETIVGERADGQAMAMLRSASVLDEADDTLIIEAFIDLSDRQRAERELAQVSEYNRLLVDSTGEGIFGVDRALCCTFANRAACRMLGHEQEALLGQDVHSLFCGQGEDDIPLARDTLPLMQAMETDSSVEAEGVFRTADGHVIPVRYLCNPLHERGEVIGAVAVFRNIAEAKAIAKKMDYLATHDALTGLLNRYAFEQRLRAQLEFAWQEGSEHVLCYIDLDQFKVVNDRCGHAAGDELLRQLSSLLHDRLRKSDTLGRLGGDEFGLLLHNCRLSEARPVVEDLIAAVSEYRFSWEGKVFSVGASVGMVRLGAEAEDLGSLMSAADAACYIAKERGRNRYHVYEADDQDYAQRQMEMEWVSRLKAALDEDKLALWVQPIVPVLSPGEVGHMEILLRMQGEAGELVNPGAFIPAAERYGLMAQVDRWVVRRVFECMAANKTSEGPLCCINLSGQSISDERFLDFLLDLMGRYPGLARHVCFEITETAAVANLSRAAQFMNRLKQEGCRFALDDFGSGMSSFAYLKHLPVDYLKIDGHFVRDMAKDEVDYAMVEAIHRVGSVMGLQTIAEFVEDRELLRHLGHIGVDFAQGYGIQRPLPMSEYLQQSLAV